MNVKKIPNGRAATNAAYGIPEPEGSDWYRQNITTVNLPFTLLYEEDGGGTSPVKRAPFHRLAAPNLVAALTTIWLHARAEVKKVHGYDLSSTEYDNLTSQWLKDAGLLGYGGTYNYRKIRGSSSVSTHAYGIAIDMAPGANALGKTTTTLPDWYIAAFTDQGFFWGGNFSGRKDPMHFQLAKGV